MASEMRKALITGGAGFIGSHIAQALVAKGCRVTILDNLASGHIENLKGVMDRITFVQGDIQDEPILAQATKDCDVVFHQAAVVSVTKTVVDPIASTAINDLGTLKVLDAARLNNVRRVVLASSSAVYGDNPELPQGRIHGRPST
jgi:UDP-glucose 4-epimerase